MNEDLNNILNIQVNAYIKTCNEIESINKNDLYPG